MNHYQVGTFGLANAFGGFMYIRKNNNITHGKSYSRVYGIWANMLQRCNNPKAANYALYGGRGIAICSEWHIFSNFLNDMGEPPLGTTLDRKNNSLGYFKENCRWATPKEQANNRRNPKVDIYKYLAMLTLTSISSADFGKIYNIDRSTASRIRKNPFIKTNKTKVPPMDT